MKNCLYVTAGQNISSEREKSVLVASYAALLIRFGYRYGHRHRSRLEYVKCVIDDNSGCHGKFLTQLKQDVKDKRGDTLTKLSEIVDTYRA